MKKIKLFFLSSVIIALLMSCADYNLLNEALHPTPPQLKLLSTGDSTATLSWTQYTGEDFKNYKVYRGLTDACDSLADTLSFRTDTITTVRKLAPESHYYFRVLVITKQGGIGASNVVDTTIAVNAKRVLTLYAPDTSRTTDSSVFLKWSQCTGIFNVYRIYKDTINSVDTKDTSVKTVYNDTTAVITGLMQGRTYWFKVYAFQDTSVAATSNAMDVSTKNIAVSWQQDLNISNVTDSSVFIRWHYYRGKDFINYKIYRSFTGSVQKTDSLLDSIGISTDTGYFLNPLVSSRHYYFRVFINGTQLYSNIADTTTLENKKGKLTWLPPQSITDSSVVLTWSRYPFGIGNYKLYMDTTKLVDNTRGLVPTKNYGDTVATVNGLISGMTYWFKVFAWQDTGFVAWSAPQSVQIGPCGAVWPGTLTISNVSDSSVTLHWASYGCNDFVKYSILKYSLDSVVKTNAKVDTVKTLNIKADTVTVIRGLNPGAPYEFRVFVSRRFGLDLNTNNAPVTTTNTSVSKK